MITKIKYERVRFELTSAIGYLTPDPRNKIFAAQLKPLKKQLVQTQQRF